LREYWIAASIFISLVKDAEKKLIKRKYNAGNHRAKGDTEGGYLGPLD
jgi:hypothetical protein